MQRERVGWKSKQRRQSVLKQSQGCSTENESTRIVTESSRNSCEVTGRQGNRERTAGVVMEDRGRGDTP